MTAKELMEAPSRMPADRPVFVPVGVDWMEAVALEEAEALAHGSGHRRKWTAAADEEAALVRPYPVED